MIDRLRRSLGARILLLAALNLALLAAIALAASGVRLPRSVDDLIVQAAGERLGDVSRRLALDVTRTPRAEANVLLERYRREYSARFLLVLNDGTLVAGERMTLPAEVLAGIAGPPPRGDVRGARPSFANRGPGGAGTGPGAHGGPDGGGAPGADGGPEAGLPRGTRAYPAPGVGPAPGSGPGAGPGRFGPPDPDTGLRMPQTPPILIRAAQAPHTWIGLRMPIHFADATNILPGTLLVVPDSLLGSALFPPIRWLAWALLALGVTLICWLPLLRGLTRSLVRMEHATGRIAEGRFDTKLAIDRPDEVGRLASSIEQMATRLDVLVSGQKRFLGDTAHELRSPLGRMRVALEILADRSSPPDQPDHLDQSGHLAAPTDADASDTLDSRSREEFRSYVADLQEDVEELASLTDALLEFARVDIGARTTPAVETDVADAVRRAVRRESLVGVDVEIAVPEGLTVMAQPDALFRAVANVLRNAVRYAGAAGPILVQAQADDDGDTVDVVVSDQGPGVPADAVDRLCEPFFRVDAARNRKTGGTGLGLAITKSAVEASGGRVACRNRVPTGLEVRLTLPRS